MTPPLTVLHTISSLGVKTGGTAQAVGGLCSALSRAGTRVEIVTLDVPGYGPRISTPDVAVSEFPSRIVTPLRIVYARKYRSALEERCEELRPALLHSHGLWGLTAHDSACVARRRKLPLVITPHGMLSSWSLNNRRWRKRIALALYQARDLRSAKLLHATSASEAADIRAAGFHNPIAVIPNGIELPDIVAPKPANSPKIALFLSRIHPVKGILDLVKAWSNLRIKDWRLIVAGPDENNYRRVVEDAVREAGLSGEIAIMPAVDAAGKWKLFRAADLFVLPSYTENFGLVIAEALAAETPVITTTATPWKQLQTESCGWWVGTGTAALQGALNEAFDASDAQRNEMGRRGRKLIEREFTWALIAGKMRAAYDWVLHGGERPDCFYIES